MAEVHVSTTAGLFPGAYSAIFFDLFVTSVCKTETGMIPGAGRWKRTEILVYGGRD